MLPASVGRQIAGLWLLRSPDGSPQCRGLEVEGADEGGFVTNLLFWSPGRLGCSTRASDIVRVGLDAQVQADGRVELSGGLPRSDGADEAFALTITPAGRGINGGDVRYRGNESEVGLAYSELEPVEDLVKE